MKDLKVTNRFNLPDEVVKAILKDRYNDDSEEPSDFSITRIIAPIQQTVLLSRHQDDTVIADVTDFFWSFLGSIAHQVLEEQWHEQAGSFAEKRLYTTAHGKTISGKLDNYKDWEIRDYKSTKSYKIMKGDYTDWERQLNCYAHLCRVNGYPVKAISVIALIFDYKEFESYKKNYPPAPVQVIRIPLWSDDRAKRYLEDRVKDLLRASTINDQSLPYTYPCSKEEMWQDVKDHSVIKKGSTKARKTFDDLNAAHGWFNQNIKDKENYDVVTRYKTRKRCFKYCPVRNHCHQHAELCKREGIVKEKDSGDRPIF